MKIKLVLKGVHDQSIWSNAERTAQRVQQWPAWKRSSTVSDDSEVTASATTPPLSGPAVDKK